MLERKIAWILALAFYASMLPWNVQGAGDFYNYNASDIVAKSPWADVRAYGPIYIGSDASAAQKTANANTIKAALNSIPTGNDQGYGIGKTILLPPGIIYVDGNVIKIGINGTHLKGMGMHTTSLWFDSGVAIEVHSSMRPSSIIQFCSIEDMTIQGAGTAFKVGLKLVDVSNFYMNRVMGFYISGKKSIGLQTQGRDTTQITNCSFVADIPLSIESNPHITYEIGNVNTALDLDVWNFHNLFLGSTDVTQPCIKVGNGTRITNTTFDGAQSWNGGKYGFYWYDTTTDGRPSGNLTISGLRYEQLADNTGKSFYINMAGTSYVSTVLFQNVTTSWWDGIFLGGKIFGFHAISSNLSGSGSGWKAFESESTVYPITFSVVGINPLAIVSIGAKPRIIKEGINGGYDYGLWDIDNTTTRTYLYGASPDTVEKYVQVSVGTVKDNSAWSTTVSVPGVKAGYQAVVGVRDTNDYVSGFPTGTILHADVRGDNNVAITIWNKSGTTIGSRTYEMWIRAFRYW